MSRIALRAASSARLAASIRPASLIPLYSVARSSALSAHGILASDVQRFLSRQYSASTAAKQQATGPAGETSSAKDGGKPNEGAEEQANEEQYNDEAYYADEPLAARVSRYIWTTIKYSFGIGIVGLVFYAGYTIVVTLLPGGSSANAIMRQAGNVLRSDPELHSVYGQSLKSYGEDFGGKNEGRRYFVPEYTYTDNWDGQTYTRVRFHIEGDRGRKGVAWAEVKQGTYDFRYLIVMAKDKSRVWSVIDNRRAPPTGDERASRLTSVLAEHGWTFFADSESDIRAQAESLGPSEYFSKVKCVRCDATPALCDEAGVLTRPAWRAHAGLKEAAATNGVLKGVRSLAELEELTREVTFKKAKAWYQFW